MVNDQGKEVSLRKTLAYDTRYGIGVFCLTGEREEQIGWVPEKERSLFDMMPLEWRIIYRTLAQKFTMQAARILEISLQR